MRLQVLTFTVIAASLTLAEAASAASSICRFVPIVGKCDTGTVSANKSGHFVFIEVSPNANWRVVDETTKVTVKKGTSGWLGTRKTIFGLYGTDYKLYVDNPLGGFGYINNN